MGVFSMNSAENLTRPYKPCFIHVLNAWIDRFPGSEWLLYLTILIIVGIVQHGVAWSKGALSLGEFNFYLSFSAIWVVQVLYLARFSEYGAGAVLDDYRPNLNVTDEQFSQLRYSFTTIPSRSGTFLFIVGFGIGILLGQTGRSINPEINYVFPFLAYFIWAITLGIGVPLIYQMIRQLRSVRDFYAMTEKIDLFDLSPIYGFSKFTATAAIWMVILIFITPFLLTREFFETTLLSVQNLIFAIVILAMFYLPLSDVNKRLASEKSRLLKEVDARIEIMRERIHTAFEKEDYREIGDKRNLLLALREEKVDMEAISTWPWQRSTITALISALVLPIVLIILQQIITNILGF